MSALKLLLCTGLGTGYSPVAPGTAGSALALALAFALHRWAGDSVTWFLPAAAALATVAGFWSAGHGEAHFGREDPGPVVIDEIAGQLWTLAFLPGTPALLLTGFFLFRLLDIVKPPPARRLESLGGGTGIMADDLMVAVYGNLALQVAVRTVWPGAI